MGFVFYDNGHNPWRRFRNCDAFVCFLLGACNCMGAEKAGGIDIIHDKTGRIL